MGRSTGHSIPGGIAIANVGNDDATSVRVQEDLPLKGFAPAPPVPPAMAAPYGALADPAPTSVSALTGLSDPRLRYEWAVGAMPAGSAWDVAFNLVAGQAGTYRLIGRITYADGSGAGYTEAFLRDIVVAPPA